MSPLALGGGAVQGDGSDEPLELLDPDHPDYGPFTELRIWQATIDHGGQTLSASGAGLFHYNNDGALLNPDGSPSHASPFFGWDVVWLQSNRDGDTREPAERALRCLLPVNLAVGFNRRRQPPLCVRQVLAANAGMETVGGVVPNGDVRGLELPRT